METFNASSCWVMKWKKKHRIVSRKGTRIVSTKGIQESAQVRQSGIDFVEKIKPLIPIYGEENVYNTDQSGFKLELYSGRTLAEKGSKIVELSYQQSNSATHSYTIQPTYSVSGHVFTPLLIVLAETNGEFGVRVANTMFKHPVLFICATSSGLVTKPVIKDWYEHVFYKNCGDQCLLMLDSLTSYKDHEYFDQVRPDHIECQVETIPAGTTGQIQPCDVGIFRTLKSFHRRLSDAVRLNCPEIRVYLRDNILRLTASTHIQFSSPRFKDFIRNSFVRSGYVDRVCDNYFDTPLNYCFHRNVKKSKCFYTTCEAMACIRCAWCEQLLCLRHFAFSTEIHFCYNAKLQLDH